MAKRHEQDLRIVQGVVEAQLAERDAEIARLRAQVETMRQAQAYAENTILRQRWMMDAQKRTASDAIAERDASIARMEKQLSGNLDAETNERIAQIMSRWTVSTPGEWITTADSPDSAYYSEVIAVHNQDDPDYGTMSHVLTVPELDDRPNDLIFAACAHQDIPFLVGVISEFSGRYTTLRKHVDYLNDVHERGREFSRERTGEMVAEIKMLRAQVDAWQATGNTIMQCAVGREAPLSDSDVCGEINALRQQVAELRRQLAAWKMEYTLEVDEFNAGHAAYNEGKRIDEEPPTTRFDEWRIGWVWGKWNAETR